MSVSTKRKNVVRRRMNFTLIEVMIVIVILVSLASIATPMYLNYIKKANVSVAKTQIGNLKDALLNYKMDTGHFPDTAAGLQALVENVENSEKWDGPYLNPAKIPLDPWGNEYVYVFPGENSGGGMFDLSSLGADGTAGGEGENSDINSWE